MIIGCGVKNIAVWLVKDRMVKTFIFCESEYVILKMVLEQMVCRSKSGIVKTIDSVSQEVCKMVGSGVRNIADVLDLKQQYQEVRKFDTLLIGFRTRPDTRS